MRSKFVTEASGFAASACSFRIRGKTAVILQSYRQISRCANRQSAMPLYWLVYRHNNQISIVIEPAASLIHAKMRSVIDGLDQGELTEGHELDRRSRVSEGDDRSYQKA